MKKWQKFSTISLSLAASIVAIFLFVFFFAQSNKSAAPSLTPSHAATEIDPSNLPTDYWTDYATQPATGAGTAANPYIITSGEELAWFADVYSAGKYIELGADIDLSAHLWKPVNMGIFDGKDYTISNMYIKKIGGGYASLFYTSGAVMQNFKIKNSFIYCDRQNTSTGNVAFVCAQQLNGQSGFRNTYQNISIQDSEIQIINNYGEAFVGAIAGYEKGYCTLGGDFSAINVKISLSAEETPTSSCYIGALFGKLTNVTTAGYGVVVDNVNIYLDLPSSNTKMFYVGEFRADQIYAIYEFYCDLNYSLSSTTPANNVKINRANGALYSPVVRKTDNLTQVPDVYDKTIWSNADPTSEFKSIFPNVRYFIEYYDLKTDFEVVEFWADYAQQPRLSSNTFYVSTPKELAWFIENKPTSVTQIYLENDIDLSGKLWTPIKLQTRTTINGRGFSIKNMTLNLNYGRTSQVTTYVGFCFINDQILNMTNLTFDNAYILNNSRRSSTFGVIASSSSTSTISKIENVGVTNLRIESVSATSIYCFMPDIGGGFIDCAVLDADVNVSGSANVYGGPNFTSPALNKFVVTGNFDIEDASGWSKVYVCGQSTKNATINCLVSAKVNILKDGQPSGEIFVFPTLNQTCMSAASNFVAKTIHHAEFSDLTTIPREFMLEDWKLSSEENQNWPYILVDNKPFKKYYGLKSITYKNYWKNFAVSPANGKGTEEDPWHIYSAEELSYLCLNYREKQFYAYLEADIDLSGHIWTPIGESDTSKLYSLDLYGNGFSIRNMDVGFSSTGYSGFIGCAAYVRMYDVTFENPKVIGLSAGVLAGNCRGISTINNVAIKNADCSGVLAAGLIANDRGPRYTNCVVSGEIVATSTTGSATAAGLCAYGGGKIINCINYANVTALTSAKARGSAYGLVSAASTAYACKNYGKIIANSDAAGLIGVLNTKDARIDDCVNYGDIELQANSYTGATFNSGGVVGLIGASNAIIVKNSSNFGNITTIKTLNAAANFGGVVGCANGGSIIENCKNYGEMSVYRNAGGIAGESYAIVKNCYNTAKITSQNLTAGGIVGNSSDGEITGCLNTGSVLGQLHAGGIVGTGTNVNVSGCKAICDVKTTSTSTTSVAYAGGILADVNSTSGAFNIADCYFEGTVTSKSLSVGGLVGYTNAATGAISNCLVKGIVSGGAMSSATYGIGGFVGSVAGTSLSVLNSVFSGQIISSSPRSVALVYVSSGSVDYESCYYDYIKKTSASAEGEIFKSYVLGQTETEESAFSAENWLLNDSIGMSNVPVPRSLLWSGDYLENTQNVLTFLKENGFTAAA